MFVHTQAHYRLIYSLVSLAYFVATLRMLRRYLQPF